MPFVKDDKNINRLDTLPEKFTKEFIDYERIQIYLPQMVGYILHFLQPPFQILPVILM